MKAVLAAIAKLHLSLETLESQNSGLDFKEQSVWSIEAALKAAFIAGQEAGDIIILTLVDDYWSFTRKSYIDQRGNHYAEVDGSIHTVTDIDGEPVAPITKKYFIED